MHKVSCRHELGPLSRQDLALGQVYDYKSRAIVKWKEQGFREEAARERKLIETSHRWLHLVHARSDEFERRPGAKLIGL